MDEQNLIDLRQLQELCNVSSPQAMLQWVKRHLTLINKDDVHAEKVGKSWLFDNRAVELILSLRRGGSNTGIENTNHAKENELRGNIEGLERKLTLAQGVVAQKQDIIIRLQAQLMDNVKLISEASSKEAQAVANASILQVKVDMLEAKVAELQADKDRLLSILSGAERKKKKRKKK